MCVRKKILFVLSRLTRPKGAPRIRRLASSSVPAEKKLPIGETEAIAVDKNREGNVTRSSRTRTLINYELPRVPRERVIDRAQRLCVRCCSRSVVFVVREPRGSVLISDDKCADNCAQPCRRGIAWKNSEPRVMAVRDVPRAPSSSSPPLSSSSISYATFSGVPRQDSMGAPEDSDS